ncbi:hypothetical protein VI03_25700 [Burkholderia vietnamiensis]|nr:hypothetical protein VI03_25700 [Burkholderia vietnamiensis]
MLLTTKATNKTAEASHEMAYAAYLASFTAEEKLYVVAAARSWQQDKRGTGFFQSVELNSFEDVIHSLGRGLVHDFILKGQREAAERSNEKVIQQHHVQATRNPPQRALSDLYQLWDKLGDAPTSDDGQRLDESFLHFGKGAEMETVWRWFEAQNPQFVVGEVMQGIRKTDEQAAKLPEVAELAVEKLKAGDKVDLRSCPFLKDHASAEFEYAVVESVERETPECVAVSYEVHGVVGYPVGCKLKISSETMGSRVLQQERQAPSGGHCEDCKWSARSGGGKCEGCLALDEAAEGRNPQVFEVTAYGFDARDDKTDDRVFWIHAVSEESVNEAIRGTGALLRGVVDSGLHVDFRLPNDLRSLRDRLMAIQVEMPETGRDSVKWKDIADDLYGAVDSLETQVHQMMGMFSDDDGEIQKALDEAGDATSAYKAARFVDRPPAGKSPKKRIMAVFQPQAWVNDHAMDIDHRTDVDVTDKVLSLPLDTIHRLADDDYDTDDLVDLQALGHNGPFYVEVSKQVCEFFGVAELSDVTEDMLASARQATVKAPQYQDEEVIGFDKDGCVMQWDGERGLSYNSGESLDEFGLHNLREHELTRVNVTRDTWLAAVAAQAAKHVATVEVAVPALDPKFASEPTYTAGMRVARMEQAVKAWNVADESDAVCAQPDEHAVVCMLADLRHYCDAHGMDFAQMDRHAYADYLEQKANDRHHETVTHAPLPGM